MKLAFAGVLGGLQSLSHDEARERPVDRLGGLAAAQIARAEDAERTAAICSLGVDLIRFKYAHVAAARLDAEDVLALVLQARPRVKLSSKDRERVARWALHEWANDACPPRPDGCGGALQIPDHDVQQLEGTQPMRSCPICRGSGKRLWKDEERIEAMGAPFAAAMDEAHSVIAWAESLAIQRGMDQCERY